MYIQDVARDREAELATTVPAPSAPEARPV